MVVAVRRRCDRSEAAWMMLSSAIAIGSSHPPFPVGPIDAPSAVRLPRTHTHRSSRTTEIQCTEKHTHSSIHKHGIIILRSTVRR